MAMAPVGAMPSMFDTGLMVVDVIFPLLATAAVALRLYTRKAKGGKFLYLDDYLILITLVFCWANTVNTIVGAAEVGVNTAKVPITKETVVTVRTLWIEGFLLEGSLTFVKLSILAFYYRIFITKTYKTNWPRIAIFTVAGMIISWFISSIVCQFLATNPIQASWNPLIPFKYYFDYNTWTVAFAGLSLFFDVVVLLFPLPLIGKLQMNLKRKVSLLGIFWLGAFCCVAAAVRFYYLYTEIFKVTAGNQANTNPYTNLTKGFIWAHIEPNSSVVAACLPNYGYFFRAEGGLLSFFKSMRSILSIPSRTGTSMAKSNPTKEIGTGSAASSQNGLHQPGYELNDSDHSTDHYNRGLEGIGKSRIGVTVEASGDLEAQHGMRGIGVERRFEQRNANY